MKTATRVYASTFGAIMALAGIEHGIGEILQGNVTPDGIMILSWPESGFFRSLGGEPAMTLIPNLLVTGVLAVLVSLVFLVWSALFIHRKRGGQVMMLLSVVLLLVGGGIFPPVLAMGIGAAATRIHVPASRAHHPNGDRRFLAKLWPWAYTAGILSWFAMLPGIPLLDTFFGVDNPIVMGMILFFALGTLLLAACAGFAYDRDRKPLTALS